MAKKALYIGTLSVMAELMTRLDYNDYRGWDLPSDEDGTDEGYLVTYPTKQQAWMEKSSFENMYTHESGEEGHTFGAALEMLKLGQRVARAGWNGKGMFLFLVAGSNNLKVNREPLISILGEGSTFTYQPHVDMYTADGTIVPWLCSQTDMLSKDWVRVPNAED